MSAWQARCQIANACPAHTACDAVALCSAVDMQRICTERLVLLFTECASASTVSDTTCRLQRLPYDDTHYKAAVAAAGVLATAESGQVPPCCLQPLGGVLQVDLLGLSAPAQQSRGWTVRQVRGFLRKHAQPGSVLLPWVLATRAGQLVNSSSLDFSPTYQECWPVHSMSHDSKLSDTTTKTGMLTIASFAAACTPSMGIQAARSVSGQSCSDACLTHTMACSAAYTHHLCSNSCCNNGLAHSFLPPDPHLTSVTVCTPAGYPPVQLCECRALPHPTSWC